MHQTFTRPIMLTQEVNYQTIQKLVHQLVDGNSNQCFLLLDGDRTLSPVDTTLSFLKHAGITEEALEACFEPGYYSFDMFLRVAQLYSAIPPSLYEKYCQKAVDDLALHPEFIPFVQQASQKVQVVVITAGVRLLWDKLLTRFGIREQVTLIGGGHFHFDKYVIDQVAKGLVVEVLHQHDKQVIAMGDSLVDFDMLTKANDGYLVVDHRQNRSVVEKLRGKEGISQVSFSDFEHVGIPRVHLTNLLEKL